jgi:transposase
MYGTTTTADGIPVLGQVLSGNTSDKKWQGGMLDVVKRTLKPAHGVHSVGDSALVTTENLAIAAGHGTVVTARLPRPVAVCNDVVTRVLSSPSQLEVIGTFSERKGAASYSGCVLREEVLGRPVQLGVFRPEKLDERATAPVLRRQARALAAARKAAAVLMKKTFGCAHDAREALSSFERAYEDELLRIKGDVIVETIVAKRPRGRPQGRCRAANADPISAAH